MASNSSNGLAAQDVESNRKMELISSSPSGKHHEINEDKLSLLSDRVIGELLGDRPEGFHEYFYKVDPFREDQYVRAPKSYRTLNSAFAVFYFLCVLGYGIWACVYYVDQPPSAHPALGLASQVAPDIELTLKTVCSNANQCGEWEEMGTTDKWKLKSPIIIKQRWEHVKDDSPCKKLNGKEENIAMSDTAKSVQKVTICASSDNQDGITVYVPFTGNVYGNDDVYLNVQMVAQGVNTKEPYKPMDNTQRVAVGELKTAFLSQTVVKDLVDDINSSEPYVADLFYNGHVNTKLGTLDIKAQQFVQYVELKRAITLLELAGSVGGFAGFLLTVLTVVRFLTVKTLEWYNSTNEINAVVTTEASKAPAAPNAQV